jgi:hypothetical protein
MEILPYGNILISNHEIKHSGDTAVAKAATTHVLYTISVPVSSKSSSALSVTRRYRDFVWLKNSLIRTVPGAILPPLPSDTGGRGNTNPLFINARKAGLVSFLNSAQLHAELVETDYLR